MACPGLSGARWGSRLRLLRAQITLAGHDSLCLFPTPEVLLCRLQCDMAPSRLLGSDSGRRNFQDGIYICQTVGSLASDDGWVMAGFFVACQRPRSLRRVRYLAFGTDSLSPVIASERAVGSIAPAYLQTVRVVPSRPKKAATCGHDATPSVASRAHPPPVCQICFPITARRHTLQCVG